MKQKLEDWLFNGYVRKPIPIVLITVVLGIVATAFAVISTWEYLHISDSSIQTEILKCVITGYEQEKGSSVYLLHTDCNIGVYIPTDAVQNSHIFDSLITEQNIVSIEYIKPSSSEFYRVSVMSVVKADGIPIITQDEVLKARKEDGKQAQIILWGVCLCYWIMWGISYYILCNAPNHPKLTSLLIRKPYRNF